MDLHLSVIAMMSPYESEPKFEPFKQMAHVILATDIWHGMLTGTILPGR